MKRLVLMFLVGCTTTQQPPCELSNGADIAALELRNPATGQCEAYGSPCDDACGPCPGLTDVQPNWPTCYGACEGLTEATCLTTPSCHAAYQDDSAQHPVFWGCWDVLASNVAPGGCANLDATTCLEHDDCTSLYTGPVNQPPNFVPSFESCHAETAQVACAGLDETACVARTDCDAVYNGMNCTCDSSGCTCATEVFAACK